MSEALKGLDQLEPIKILNDELKPKEDDEIKIEFPKKEDETKKIEASDTIVKTFAQRMEDIMSIVRAVSGGATVDSRIDPILRPKNWKTTTILTKGEIQQILALISFCKTSPTETECVLEYCEDLCYLKLSESGFAIEKAIDLGKALAEKTITGLVSTPEKPTDGMKKK